jgi:hypothetical protein
MRGNPKHWMFYDLEVPSYINTQRCVVKRPDFSLSLYSLYAPCYNPGEPADQRISR